MISGFPSFAFSICKFIVLITCYLLYPAFKSYSYRKRSQVCQKRRWKKVYQIIVALFYKSSVKKINTLHCDYNYSLNLIESLTCYIFLLFTSLYVVSSFIIALNMSIRAGKINVQTVDFIKKVRLFLMQLEVPKRVVWLSFLRYCYFV